MREVRPPPLPRDAVPRLLLELLEEGSNHCGAEADYTLEIGGGLTIPVHLDATTKGNGGMEVPGLSLHLLDGHGDGVVYDGDVLRTEFVDVDGDGYLDLVVTGDAIEDQDEKGLLPGVRAGRGGIYRFDPGRGVFVVLCERPERSVRGR